MKNLSIKAFRDGGTVGITVEPPSGPASVSAFRASQLAEGAPFAVPFLGLSGALEIVAAKFALQAGRLQPEALQDELRAQIASLVGTHYRAARDDVRQAKRDNAARVSRVNEVPNELPFDVEDRADFRSRDLTGQGAWISSASRDQLAALVAAGHARFPLVPAPLWQDVLERHAILAHIEKTGLQADYQLQPTPQNPAAIGPDVKAAEAAARSAMERQRAHQSRIEDAEATLTQVVVVIAAATGLSVNDAHKLLDEGQA